MLALPSFSTDTQRFLADGINIVHAKNPYTARPPVEIKYAHLRSFYPPLQQLAFGGVALVAPSAFAFRVFAGMAELLFVLWFLVRKKIHLSQSRKTRYVALFLLLNPVSVHEIWREGHLDHIAAFLLCLAIWNTRASLSRVQSRVRRYAFSFLAIGWKFTGIFAAAYFLPRRTRVGAQSLWQRGKSVFAIACGFFFVLQILPAMLMTPFAEQGLMVYAQYWHHGNAIVQLFSAFGFADAHGIFIVQRGILVATVVYLMLYAFGRLRFYDALYLSIGTLVVFFPVQHPWYYFLLFPGVFFSHRWGVLYALLCLLSPLSYLGYLPAVAWSGFLVTAGVWCAGAVRVLRTAH